MKFTSKYDIGDLVKLKDYDDPVVIKSVEFYANGMCYFPDDEFGEGFCNKDVEFRYIKE